MKVKNVPIWAFTIAAIITAGLMFTSIGMGWTGPEGTYTHKASSIWFGSGIFSLWLARNYVHSIWDVLAIIIMGPVWALSRLVTNILMKYCVSEEEILNFEPTSKS